MRGRSNGSPAPADPQPDTRPTIQRERYRGADGLRGFPIIGRLEAPDPASFDAVITRARLGRVDLRRVELSPHRAIIDGQMQEEQPEILRLLTIQRGSILAAPPGDRPIRLQAGDAMFTSRSRPYAYRTTEPLVLVNSVLPLASLPPSLRRLDRLPVGPLPHSPLVDAVVDLMANLAERFDEPWAFDADYAARGLIELETAILTEVIGPEEPAVGPERVYAAAVDYIERHLGDPDLRPPQIAEALGVSLRYLHKSFDDKEATVARHLRERRLDLVADALRSGARSPQLASLAERYGFSSQDRLARAFRRRYGVSMSDYRASIADE
jgi:AraC family transcriptional activator of tynA and feaB